MHALALEAVVERRALIRWLLRGSAGAVALGGAGALLAACTRDEAAAPATTTLPDPDLPWWMQGNFAPVADEVEAVDLEVVGALPPALTGLYARNGSNPAAGRSTHWFLGDGMVHGVRLERGQAVWYRNRWVRTPLVASGSEILGSGGSGATAAAPGRDVNPSNTSVVVHGGKLLSLCEVGYPYELSPVDLSTVGPFDFGGSLTTAMTAHPKLDPVTGRQHFFGYGFVPPFLTYHVAEPDGTLVHSEEVPVPGPTMIHDFAVTDRDVVFWDLPVVFDLQLAVQGEMPFVWDPAYGARVGVMPLGGPASAMRWAEIEPCYVFHGTNAYRDGDRVVVDVGRMPTMFRTGGDAGSVALHRWTIDTSGPQLQVADQQRSDLAIDLPTIDPRRVGRRHTRAWYANTAPDPGAVRFTGVAAVDERGATDVWDPGPARAAGEGLFVPDGPGEGEGWVLVYVYDRTRDGSDLVVLDAMDLAAGPVAEVRLPQRVPFGFHGTWLPA